MKKTILITGLLFVNACFASAEVIQLKNGQTIEGKIIEKTDTRIKLDMDLGVPITYYLDEISSIKDQDGKIIYPEGAESPSPVESEEKSPKKINSSPEIVSENSSETTNNSVAPIESLPQSSQNQKENPPNIERMIVERYGIKVDVSFMDSSFDPESLIMEILDINAKTGKNFKGVVISDSDAGRKGVRVLKTADHSSQSGLPEPSQLLLVINRAYASQPKKMLPVIRGDASTTIEGQVESGRMSTLQAVIGADEPDDGSVGKKIVNAAGGLIKDVDEEINNRQKDLPEPLPEDNLSLSFSEAFSPELFGQNPQEPITDGPYVQNYENGKIKLKTNIKNGKQDGRYEEFYENGQLKAEAEYLDGRRLGAYKEYHPNGNLAYLENYKNGKVDGPVEEYDDKGNLYRKVFVVEGRKNGLAKEYYTDGKTLRVEVNFENDQMSGDYKEYDEKGVLRVDGMYKQDKMNGAFKFYNEEGKLVKEEMYQNDLKEGPFKEFTFDKNGSYLKGNYINGLADGVVALYSNENVLLKEMNYKHGKRNGVTKEFYPEGKLKLEMNFKDDVPEGAYKDYHPNGKLAYEQKFLNGKVNGKVKEYYASGPVMREMDYAEGQKQGAYREFYETGEKMAEATFDKDELVSQKLFDKSGKEVQELPDSEITQAESNKL